MTQAAISLLILTTTAIGFAAYFHIAQKRRSSRVDDFFQAGRNIGIPLFTQTTWGSSFAFGNSIFYAVWLGYSMGLTALWLQAIWALGMAAYALMLPRLVPLTETYTLHGFLGSHYGTVCRILASVISSIGLIVLLGFELSFAAQYFSQVTATQHREWLIVLVVAVFFASFCSIGGFQANSRTDRISNYLAVGALIILLFVVAAQHWDALHGAFTPSAIARSATASTGWSNLAILGIAFFALFNFVDMTNWQTVSANSLTSGDASASAAQQRQMRNAMLRAAGLFLVAPVFTGTLLGYMLRVLSIGTEDQSLFMSHLVLGLVGGKTAVAAITLALVTFIFVASSLSGVDSWMLATAQTISWDLLDYSVFREHDFDVRKFEPALHERITRRARAVLLMVGVLGAGGVYYVSKYVWKDIFSLQFVIFGGGLAMLPSLLFAIYAPSRRSAVLTVGATLSIALGYGSAIVLFVLSVIRQAPRFVEPLPVVALSVAAVTFAVTLLIEAFRRYFAKSTGAKS
jgi:Na+/proline symporter